MDLHVTILPLFLFSYSLHKTGDFGGGECRQDLEINLTFSSSFLEISMIAASQHIPSVFMNYSVDVIKSVGTCSCM